MPPWWQLIYVTLPSGPVRLSLWECAVGRGFALGILSRDAVKTQIDDAKGWRPTEIRFVFGTL
jgi:hypothetical protein